MRTIQKGAATLKVCVAAIIDIEIRYDEIKSATDTVFGKMKRCECVETATNNFSLEVKNLP